MTPHELELRGRLDGLLLVVAGVNRKHKRSPSPLKANPIQSIDVVEVIHKDDDVSGLLQRLQDEGHVAFQIFPLDAIDELAGLLFHGFARAIFDGVSREKKRLRGGAR